VERVLSPLHLLHGDGGAEKDLRSSGAMPKDEGEFSSGALFFIPSRRVTRLTLREFVSAWCDRHNVKGAIDSLCVELDEKFYLPLSTAYEWLSLIRKWCRLEFSFLGINPNELTCLFEMRRIDSQVILRVFDPDFPKIAKPP
jgi:hypothetical protein